MLGPASWEPSSRPISHPSPAPTLMTPTTIPNTTRRASIFPAPITPTFPLAAAPIPAHEVIQQVLHASVSRLIEELTSRAPGVVDLLGPAPDIQRAVAALQTALGLPVADGAVSIEGVEGADDPPPSYNEVVAHDRRLARGQAARRRAEPPTVIPAPVSAEAPAAPVRSRRPRARPEEEEEQEERERTRVTSPAPASALVPAPPAALSRRRSRDQEEEDGEQVDDEGRRIARRPRLTTATNNDATTTTTATNSNDNASDTSNSNTLLNAASNASTTDRSERTHSALRPRLVTPANNSTNTTTTTSSTSTSQSPRRIAHLPRRDATFHAGSGCCPPNHTGPCRGERPRSIYETAIFVPMPTQTTSATSQRENTVTAGTERRSNDEPKEVKRSRHAEEAAPQPHPMFRVAGPPPAPYVPPSSTAERGPRHIAGIPGSARRLRELAAAQPAPQLTATPAPQRSPAPVTRTRANPLPESQPVLEAQPVLERQLVLESQPVPPRMTQNAHPHDARDPPAFSEYAGRPSAFATAKNFMLAVVAHARPVTDAAADFAAYSPLGSVGDAWIARLESLDNPRHRTITGAAVRATSRGGYNPYPRP